MSVQDLNIEIYSTWEPLDQLHEDVSEKVSACVKTTASPSLTATLKKWKPKLKKKGGRDNVNAATTTAVASAIG